MDAKHILGMSVLAVAGAVSAQTVPQEQWVGAPVAAAGSLSRADVAAESLSAFRLAQAPQELQVGPPELRSAATDRASVVAELRTWLGAGGGQFASGERFDAPAAPFHRARRMTTMAPERRDAPVLPPLAAAQGLSTAAAGSARVGDGVPTQ